ncbi:PREDICTED: lopap-like [Papilio polytes]|uniref:lopap-like n=1 Tax=Papilio polytes TaxID=76194 RepID=UPI0006762F33|nr:PREDICTED: lopap-like [Papilio polytes]
MKTVKAIVFLICFECVYSYFTLPGRCPENVELQDNFILEQFDKTWYQAYHYSSDGQLLSNCSTVELLYKPTGIYVNISRVDLGLFHRQSIGQLKLVTPKNGVSSNFELSFTFENAPRRLKVRRYPYQVLATNYKYYATVYTCQYSPLINKHFIYVWILSRNPTLNDVSKDLALKPLKQLGINQNDLVKETWSKCSPKYYESQITEPRTFRYSVPI